MVLLLILLGVAIGAFLTWDYLNVIFAQRLNEYQESLKNQCLNTNNWRN